MQILLLLSTFAVTLAAGQVMMRVPFFEPVTGSLPGFPVYNVAGFNSATGCARQCRITAGCVASTFKARTNGQVRNMCDLKSRMVLSNWVPSSNGVYCTNPAEPCVIYRKTGSATDTAPFHTTPLIQEYTWEPTATLLGGWPQSGVPATANAGLCEAWCQYYSTCKAFVWMPTYGTQKQYCALYGYTVNWLNRASSARCPPTTRCVIKRK